MQITFKNKKYQIKCDSKMPYFNAGEDGECAQCIPACKGCILKHLEEMSNGGWDNETNIEYDMYMHIVGDPIKL